MTQFQDLPTEITEKIFEECYHMDKSCFKNHFKTLSLVCRQWLKLMEIFHRKYFVVCIYLNRTNKNIPNLIFQRSLRSFYNLRIISVHPFITDITINKNILADILRNFNNRNILRNLINFLTLPNITITSLELSNCMINIGVLCEIISPLKYLKEIVLSSNTFNCKEAIDIESNKIAKVSNILSQLNYFTIIYNHFHGDATNLLKIFSCTKNLEYIEINHNFDMQHNKNILDSVIKQNSATLKVLKISPSNIIELSCIDNAGPLHSFPVLNIKKLQILYFKSLTRAIPFLSLNSNIVELYLDFYTKEQTDFKIISEMLRNLESLTLLNGKFNNLNLFTISNFTKLTKLTLILCQYDFTTPKKIFKIENLKYLKIERSYCYKKNVFIDIAKNIPNLEVLLIKGDSLFDDIAMQSILKNLTKLKNLSVIYCDLTDFGITGFNKLTRTQAGYSIKSLNYLKNLAIGGSKLTKNSLYKFEFPNLQYFTIYDFKMDADMFEKIVLNCPKIKFVTVSKFFDYKNCNNIEYKIKYERSGSEHCYMILH